MYSFFEKLLNPFPNHDPSTPPNSIFAFCLHYSKGAKRYILAMGMFTGLIAIVEVSLYGFVGNLVDWLNMQEPSTVFDGDSNVLIYAALALVLLPTFIFIQATIMHQTLLGNFPMAVRWLSHRYMLGHSVGYYQNEFAGRIATKVMQTALAVREVVMKLVDVLLFVTIYFLSGLVLIFSLDWRLAIPFVIWLLVYFSLLRIFLPKLSAISQKQANARSLMTGRIVDTYTNISTVKLFSHSGRESKYAKEGMRSFLNTVHPQMRLGTSLTSLVWATSALLIFSVGAIGVFLWSEEAITTGAVAAALALVMRLNGMSHWVMWEVSALFENIGTVRDGMNTLTAPRLVQDKKDANDFVFKSGELTFDHVQFHYGKGKGVIDDFSFKL